MTAEKSFLHYIVGVSLGIPPEPHGLCVLEQEIRRSEDWGAINNRLTIRHLERLARDASYPDAAARTRDLVAALRDREQVGPSAVVIDISGIGRTALQFFTDAGLAPVAVVITGGGDEEPVPGAVDEWRVPKTALVGTLRVQFQAARVKIAEGVNEAKTFVDELERFKLRPPTISASNPDAWREGQHDDLVFAAALTSWRAEREKPTPRRKRHEHERRSGQYAWMGS